MPQPSRNTGTQRQKAGSRSRPRAHRPRGEQTRRRILQAVLEVIAREGIRGVSHRAVAARAGVQLSLTTYYFSDIAAMITEAFIHFSERMRPELDALWEGIFEYLERHSRAELRKRAVRERVSAELARRATDYILAQIHERPTGLAAEQILFTEARLSPELHRLREAHRRRLLAPLAGVCALFNPDDPELDAELLLDTITSLEYQALSIPAVAVDRQHILQLLRRHIGWITGLHHA